MRSIGSKIGNTSVFLELTCWDYEIRNGAKIIDQIDGGISSKRQRGNPDDGLRSAQLGAKVSAPSSPAGAGAALTRLKARKAVSRANEVYMLVRFAARDDLKGDRK